MLALLQSDAWDAATPADWTWHAWLAELGPWIALAAVLALVARALAQRRRYRAVGMLSDADLEAVHTALRTAESRTIGEIVPVVVERSDDHPHAGWLAALVFVGCGSALLEPHLSWDRPALVLASQAALGALGWVLARWLPSFARLFVSETRATHAAEEQATQEFARLDLHRTAAESGVLIFVSLFERRVVVLGDRGIDAKVGAEHWQALDRAVLEGLRRDSLRAGLVDGIALAGGVLAEHFPSPDGGRNELPDRVVVRAR